MSNRKIKLPTSKINSLADTLRRRDKGEEFGKRPDVISAVVAPAYSTGLVTTLDDGETTAGTKAFPAILPLNGPPAPGDKLVKIAVGSSHVVAKIGDPTTVLMPVGAGIPFFGASAPSGWLLCDGRTIGSASSGGTARANADTQTLYELLWNSTTNSELVIQTSAGSNTTRGASALADFAANKRLPLPDLRGRMPIGQDDMGGTSANRVTATAADVVAGSGGAETHTLTESEMPAHTHHTYKADGGGAPGTFETASATATPATASASASTNMTTTGSGSPFNIMSPWLAVNYLIKY